jgi:hypothetical protein
MVEIMICLMVDCVCTPWLNSGYGHYYVLYYGNNKIYNIIHIVKLNIIIIHMMDNTELVVYCPFQCRLFVHSPHRQLNICFYQLFLHTQFDHSSNISFLLVFKLIALLTQNEKLFVYSAFVHSRMCLFAVKLCL